MPPVQSGGITMHSPLSIARAAAEQFTTRQRKAAQAVASGKLNPAAATELLRPWLAAACLCGADLLELAEPLAELTAKNVDGSWSFSPGQARWVFARDLCPQDKLLGTIAAARDSALDALPDQGDPNAPQFEYASALNRMANHIGCKPFIPGCTPAQRKAA